MIRKFTHEYAGGKCHLTFIIVLLLFSSTTFIRAFAFRSPCQSPAIERLLEGSSDSELERLKFVDRVARIRDAFQQLQEKFPHELQPYHRLIFEMKQLDPVGYPAFANELYEKAKEKQNDATLQYAASIAILFKDTPESLRLLESAKKLAPESPWPSLELAWVYSFGLRADTEKSEQNLQAFFAQCPDSADDIAQGVLAGHRDLETKVAKALRARLLDETDPAHLQDYAVLWRLEFRISPPERYAFLRKQVESDVARLTSLALPQSPEWQNFLIDAWKRAGASDGFILRAEDTLLDRYPLSDEAFAIISARWHKIHPEPANPQDAVAWSRYNSEYKETIKTWIRDFPETSVFGHRRWLQTLLFLDPWDEKGGLLAVEEYLRVVREFQGDKSDFSFIAASFLLEHGWQPIMGLELLERSQELSRIERNAWANDNLTPENRKSSDDDSVRGNIATMALRLKACSLIGRLDCTTALRTEIESSPPSDKASLSDYWWNRARLAMIEKRQQDAITYYQLALHTRTRPPQYRYGKLEDELSAEAQEVWQEKGGTSAAWNLWLNPPATEQSPHTAVGWNKPPHPFAAFELKDLNGKIWRLTDLKGKAVLINIWATWCGPCKQELPHIQELYNGLSDRKDIQVLTFNVDEDPEPVLHFVSSNGYSFPVIPAKNFVDKIPDSDGGIPRTWIIGGYGNWLWEQIGSRASSNIDWQTDTIRTLEQAITQ